MNVAPNGDEQQAVFGAVLTRSCEPGQPVRLLNINSRAALVESHARLRPGAMTELQLALAGGRTSIRGRLDRCHISALEPLRYSGLLMFEEPLELEDDADT